MSCRLLLALCAVSLLFAGCRDELSQLEKHSSLTEGLDSLTLTPKDRLEQALDKEYYPNCLRFGSVEEKVARLMIDGLEPIWDKSQTFLTSRGATVLRVPISATIIHGRVADGLTSERGNLYKEVNKTFLVHVEDEKYPNGRNYLMHLVPSLDFLDGGSELDGAQSLIPRGFDGEIEIYSLDGTLQSNEFFRHGKRYRSHLYNVQRNELRSQGEGYFLCQTYGTFRYRPGDSSEEVVVIGYTEYDVICRFVHAPVNLSYGVGDVGGGSSDAENHGDIVAPSRPGASEAPTLNEEEDKVRKALENPKAKEAIEEMKKGMRSGDAKEGGDLRERYFVLYEHAGQTYVGKTHTGQYQNRMKGDTVRARIDISRDKNRDETHPIPEGARVVATVHTHPPYTYYPEGKGRPVGPSPTDSVSARRSKIPLVVVDYVGRPVRKMDEKTKKSTTVIGVVGGHSAYDSIQTYIYYPEKIEDSNKKK